MKTCHHCQQAIEHCPHAPAAFCKGWKHAGLAHVGQVVLAHFCGGISTGPLAEPELPAGGTMPPRKDAPAGSAR